MAEKRTVNLYRSLLWTIEPDVGMIYGPTGSGKSFLMEGLVQAAVEQEENAIPVAFLDTERNYTGETMKWLQKCTQYKYVASFAGVKAWVESLKPGMKLVIIDSLGAPVLGEFAKSNLRQRGEMLLGGVDVLYQLKIYCQENDAMAIITNQPVSEMAGKKDMRTGELLKALDPFGGKWGHSVKEVYRCEKLAGKGMETHIDIVVFKSRHMPTDHKLAHIVISSAGTTINFHQYIGRRGRGRIPVRIIVEKDKASTESHGATGLEGPPGEGTTGATPAQGPEEEKPKKKRPKRQRKSQQSPPVSEPGPSQPEPEPPEPEPPEPEPPEPEPPEPDSTEATVNDTEIVSTVAMMKGVAEEKGISEEKLEAMLWMHLKIKSVEEISTVEQADSAMQVVREYQEEQEESDG